MPVTRKPLSEQLKNKAKTFSYNVDAETGVIEKKEERSFVDDTKDMEYEDDTLGSNDIPTPMDSHSNADIPKLSNDTVTEFPKGKQSIAIEHALAELGSYGLRMFTAYLFRPYNAMTEEESKSSVVPPVRMIQRRIDKFLKVKLPISRMSKEDKADIEETVTAIGNYVIRISTQAFSRWIDKVKHKQPKPIVPNAKPYTQHELNVMLQRQKQPMPAQPTMQPTNGELTPEMKQAMFAAIGSYDGTE